jgi:hypothetical protein
MRGIWIWSLVDISAHHDRDDYILFLRDETVRDELLDGVLHER